MDLSHIDPEILEQIPSRYKKSNQVQKEILKSLSSEQFKESAKYIDLYIYTCKSLNPKPKWAFFQSQMRKLIKQGLVKRLSKVTFQIA